MFSWISLLFFTFLCFSNEGFQLKYKHGYNTSVIFYDKSGIASAYTGSISSTIDTVSTTKQFAFGSTNYGITILFTLNDTYDITNFAIGWSPPIYPLADGTTVGLLKVSTFVEYLEVYSSSWVDIPYIYNNFSNGIMSFIAQPTSTVFASQLQFNAFFNHTNMSICFFSISGTRATRAPTTFPTDSPTGVPTTPSPTNQPSFSPSNAPTKLPTSAPTSQPTYPEYNHETITNSSNSYFRWSENIYPLSYRNETYSTFTIPNGKAYAVVAVLEWADIDATITVEGCDQFRTGTYADPGPFYNCSGTWRLRSTAKLFGWQQTYGRVEIWETADNGLEYRHVYWEFQWNTTQCYWNNSGVIERCDFLPLTGTFSDKDEDYAAMIEYTMPKYVGDLRTRPLTILWYDLLNVGYGIRPAINYTWTNITFTSIQEGDNLSLGSIMERFEIAFISVGLLLAAFIGITLFACCAQGNRKYRWLFMLDVRNLRTTFKHRELIAPAETLLSRSRFSCVRHGPWLLIVLGARLAYMFVFTFTFFAYVFLLVNHQWFYVLNQYNSFADERDNQLTNFSSQIEEYYTNETDRLAASVSYKQTHCYADWVNLTQEEFDSGSTAQYNNHSTQMANILANVNYNLSSSTIYVTGTTACDINSSNGAVIYERDPVSTVYYFPNGTYKNTTYYYATSYKYHTDANFSTLSSVLSARCSSLSSCVGWTFIDSNGTSDASYYLLSTLASDINSDSKGVCYAVSRYSTSGVTFSSLSELQNLSSQLSSSYLSAYESQVSSVYDSLSGIWSSIKSITSDDSGDWNFTVVVNNDPTATEYDMSFQLKSLSFVYVQGKGYTARGTWIFLVTCPGCPSGNFSSPYLNEVYNYLSNYSYHNLSSLYGDTVGNSSFSDYVSVPSSFISFPSLPTISLPFDFNFPNLELPWIIGVSLSFDLILLVYRWYQTAGIMASVMRGRDVEVSIVNLMVRRDEGPTCCTARSVGDCCLNCIIWCHDKIYYLNYNIWKAMYWIWLIFKLAVVGVLIFTLYFLLDQVLTVSFIESLGTFDLLTIGIAAQRSVRNQVIATTSLAYNNYTLANTQSSRKTYATTQNAYAWKWNVEELKRVDEWNAYFCIAYSSYQGSARDVTSDGSITISNVYCPGQNISHLFDGNESTYIQPTTSHCAFDIELPGIAMTSDITVYWDIAQLIFYWSYNATNNLSDKKSPIEYSASAKLNASQNFQEQTLSSYQYSNPGYDKTNDAQSNDVSWNETRYIRMNLSGTFGNAFRLNELSFYGSAPENLIECPEVTFYYWSFNAFNISTEECPEVTPVIGVFFRGFVRTWLNDQLLDGHKPFIKAIRNIALSPFAILLVAIIILIIAYLVTFLVQWCLLRVDLYRENPFAKVPLVTTTYNDYDPEEHETGDFKKGATIAPGYLNTNISGDKSIATLNHIEMGITSNVVNPEGDKETVTQSYVRSFFRSPTANDTVEATATQEAPISTSDNQDSNVKSYVHSLLSTSTQQKVNLNHLD